MRIALFYSDGLIGNSEMSKIIPQMISMNIKPILYNSAAPYIHRKQIPELKELSFYETELLKNIVDPTLKNYKPEDQNLCLTISQLINIYGLEKYDIEDVNSNEFIAHLENEAQLDGAIAIRFYPIFKRKIINYFSDNSFLWNLHTGILPKYKGVYAPYHALENNEKYYGWTLHCINREIDTGDIIAIDQLPLNAKKPVLNTYLDMSDKGAAMIIGGLMFYQKSGMIFAQKQKSDFESYFTYPTAKEIQKWQNKKIYYVDDIIQTYTKMFTLKDSSEEKLLKDNLILAINRKTIIQKSA